MSQEIEIKLSKTAKIVFCLLTLISIFMLWTFYYFDNNDERAQLGVDILAVSPQEAIDLKEKEFFLKHQYTEIGSYCMIHTVTLVKTVKQTMIQCLIATKYVPPTTSCLSIVIIVSCSDNGVRIMDKKSFS